MKKTILAILVLALLVGLTGCSQPSQPTEDPAQTTVAPEGIPETTGAAETTAPATEPAVTEEAEEPSAPSGPEEASENYQIETRYGALEYPNKWETYTQVQISEKEPYTVSFYAALEGKEPVHLFDIVFGEADKGARIGVVYGENGETPVCIVSYDLDFDDSWTQEQQLMAWSMQEDVNVVIMGLSDLDAFVSGY